MTMAQIPASGPLSRWWKIAAIVTMVFGFTILIGLTVEAYRKAPPIPARAVDAGGAVIFTSDDVAAGQQVFLKYGLMANGTIWGHGAYLGPDFSAQYLHNWALDVADQAAQARFRRPYAEITPDQRAEIEGSVARTMKENRYDSSTGTLSLSAADADSFKRQIGYWKDYFLTPANNGGLAVKLVVGFDRGTARHCSFLHQQLSLRSARRQRADRGARHLQRAQPRVPAGWHGDRAARLRQVRPARLA